MGRRSNKVELEHPQDLVQAPRQPVGELDVREQQTDAHQRVGVVQGLLATCTLQGVDPYAYLVDVLQRVGRHPASRGDELTPRLWRTLFADDPLRSDLDRRRDPPGS